MGDAMGWIKISDDDGGIFGKEAELDPVLIVSINELDNGILELIQIKNSICLPYAPDNISEDLNAIVNDCKLVLENYIENINMEIEEKENLKILLLNNGE